MSHAPLVHGPAPFPVRAGRAAHGQPVGRRRPEGGELPHPQRPGEGDAPARLTACRRQATDLQKQLRGTIISRSIRAGDIARFGTNLADLEAMLGTISEDDPVVLLLNKIRSDRMTLADLTDDELNALRAESSIASQVALQTT